MTAIFYALLSLRAALGLKSRIHHVVKHICCLNIKEVLNNDKIIIKREISGITAFEVYSSTEIMDLAEQLHSAIASWSS